MILRIIFSFSYYYLHSIFCATEEVKSIVTPASGIYLHSYSALLAVGQWLVFRGTKIIAPRSRHSMIPKEQNPHYVEWLRGEVVMVCHWMDGGGGRRRKNHNNVIIY